ncbi:DUF2950 domain-containing protein [Starkeya koreensis]|uniref:DUF2950 domain-containing protein n=1 Tax=Ancylobacter koreensis TaxID=266121 RepID=A0ABT0DJF2_9HYPH|nr:DUF2950 domain-containing protein [Ancylobacter koreensis]MCK0207413.1 DUF2950 domain-containing protein [Ancylobacter koreensis]
MDHRPRRTLPLLAALVGFALTSPTRAQESFPSPEAAASALVEGVRAGDAARLDALFGAGARDVLGSGDADIDARRRDMFLGLAAGSVNIADGPEGEKVVVLGRIGWRFPIPLAQKDGTWSFDLAAGRQEITDRTIGRNEYAAIAACADFVAAQNEYFGALHDDEPVQQYARRFISTPGRHDGLYWPPENANDRSPLGARLAAAAREKVARGTGPRAYEGYVYRILTAQGPNAPGGAYSYLVKGRLLAGFAMLAYPERWQETGVMTFLCDQRGGVFERNLGPDTAKLAPGIRRFDPGPDWSVVDR